MKLDQMQRKLKKYVEYLLIDQSSDTSIHEHWVYHCQICGITDKNRQVLFEHLNTHSDGAIVNFILDLKDIVGREPIIQHFCDDVQ